MAGRVSEAHDGRTDRRFSEEAAALGAVRHSRAVPTSRRASWFVRLTVLMVAVGTAVIVIDLAVHRELGQRLDHMAMLHVQLGNVPPLGILSVLSRASIVAMSALAVWGIGLTVFHRSVHPLLRALILAAGANLTTQLLKHQLLERSDLGWGTHNSLPSGHTTLVASAAAVLLITTPERWRTVATALAAAATTFTGVATIVAGWHRPSDVVVALAITVAWTALVTIGSPRTSSTSWAPAVVGAIIATATLIAIGIQNPTVQNIGVLAAVSAVTAGWTWAVSLVAPADQP